MVMNALSLWQPWASLVALGEKRFETRSWSTAYRGPLLICTSKKFNRECRALSQTEPFRTSLSALPVDVLESLCGYALCLVDIVDVGEIYRPVSICAAIAFPGGRHVDVEKNEEAFGDYGSGRFAWQLENVRTFKPFAVSGLQKIFKIDVDPKLLEVA